MIFSNGSIAEDFNLGEVHAIYVKKFKTLSVKNIVVS
jgi:hypothetical protein